MSLRFSLYFLSVVSAFLIGLLSSGNIAAASSKEDLYSIMISRSGADIQEPIKTVIDKAIESLRKGVHVDVHDAYDELASHFNSKGELELSPGSNRDRRSEGIAGLLLGMCGYLGRIRGVSNFPYQVLDVIIDDDVGFPTYMRMAAQFIKGALKGVVYRGGNADAASEIVRVLTPFMTDFAPAFGKKESASARIQLEGYYSDLIMDTRPSFLNEFSIILGNNVRQRKSNTLNNAFICKQIDALTRYYLGITLNKQANTCSDYSELLRVLKPFRDEEYISPLLSPRRIRIAREILENCEKNCLITPSPSAGLQKSSSCLSAPPVEQEVPVLSRDRSSTPVTCRRKESREDSSAAETTQATPASHNRSRSVVRDLVKRYEEKKEPTASSSAAVIAHSSESRVRSSSVQPTRKQHLASSRSRKDTDTVVSYLNGKRGRDFWGKSDDSAVQTTSQSQEHERELKKPLKSENPTPYSALQDGYKAPKIVSSPAKTASRQWSMSPSDDADSCAVLFEGLTSGKLGKKNDILRKLNPPQEGGLDKASRQMTSRPLRSDALRGNHTSHKPVLLSADVVSPPQKGRPKTSTPGSSKWAQTSKKETGATDYPEGKKQTGRPTGFEEKRDDKVVRTLSQQRQKQESDKPSDHEPLGAVPSSAGAASLPKKKERASSVGLSLRQDFSGIVFKGKEGDWQEVHHASQDRPSVNELIERYGGKVPPRIISSSATTSAGLPSSSSRPSTTTTPPKRPVTSDAPLRQESVPGEDETIDIMQELPMSYHMSIMNGMDIVPDAKERLTKVQKYIDERNYFQAKDELKGVFTGLDLMPQYADSYNKASEYVVRFYLSLSYYLAGITVPSGRQYKILDPVIHDGGLPWMDQLRCVSQLLSGFHRAHTHSIGYSVKGLSTEEIKERKRIWLAGSSVHGDSLCQALDFLSQFITDLAPASVATFRQKEALVFHYLKLLNTSDVSSLNKFTAVIPYNSSQKTSVGVCRRIDAYARYYSGLAFDSLLLLGKKNESDINLIVGLLTPFEESDPEFRSILNQDQKEKVLRILGKYRTLASIRSPSESSS